MSETYWCRLHNHYLELPDDVVEITVHKKGWYKLVRFADGTTHDVRKTSRSGPHDNNAEKAAHTRWHKQSKKDACKFCYPEPLTPQATLELVIGHGASDVKRIAEEIDQQEQMEKTICSSQQ